ncbi:MAG: hypothetical protein ACI4A3_05590 [Lachnospiraceae bacterium]
MEQTEYIRELEIQITNQQRKIEQYERELFFLTKALEEANQKMENMKLQDGKNKKRRGRPSVDGNRREMVRELVQQGMSYRKVHDMTGLSLGSISAIINETAEQNSKER